MATHIVEYYYNYKKTESGSYISLLLPTPGEQKQERHYCPVSKIIIAVKWF